MADWTWVGLSGLGDSVGGLDFSLASSDNGAFVMNTPAYFALDNLTVIPEPSTVVLWTGGGWALIRLARRRRQRG